MTGRPLTLAELEQRRQAPMRHGARSDVQIRAKARNAKRRFLNRQRLRAGDLDGVALAYLDGWARATAKVELWDEHDPLGAGSREYIAASNSARLFMAKLERRLKELGLDRSRPVTGAGLRAHLERNYGGES